MYYCGFGVFFFSSRRRHTRWNCDWSSDVCSSDLELATLVRLGAAWVSLSPFGYLPTPGSPEIVPSAAGGADQESDEAVCEAGARARELGLRVWLHPHLWTRGWVGD